MTVYGENLQQLKIAISSNDFNQINDVSLTWFHKQPENTHDAVYNEVLSSNNLTDDTKKEMMQKLLKNDPIGFVYEYVKSNKSDYKKIQNWFPTLLTKIDEIKNNINKNSLEFADYACLYVLMILIIAYAVVLVVGLLATSIPVIALAAFLLSVSTFAFYKISKSIGFWENPYKVLQEPISENLLYKNTETLNNYHKPSEGQNINIINDNSDNNRIRIQKKNIPEADNIDQNSITKNFAYAHTEGRCIF